MKKNKTGIQITSTRIGKLEKKVIQEALNLPKSAVVLDLGAGNGFVSVILSLLQKEVYFYDLKIDFKLKIFKKLFASKKLHLEKKDLRKILASEFPRNIDLVYSARFLHYLSYEEAENFLRKFSARMKPGGKFFFTFSGLYSDIGKKYPCTEKKIFERNCFLEKSWQKKFEIREKITLYTKNEAQELFEKFFEIEEIWESDFKNIFIVGRKK